MTDQNEIEDDLTDGGLAEKKSADQHSDRLLTRWLHEDTRERSGHAGGGLMSCGAWLKAERALLFKKGIATAIVAHPTQSGVFALARCS